MLNRVPPQLPITCDWIHKMSDNPTAPHARLSPFFKKYFFSIRNDMKWQTNWCIYFNYMKKTQQGEKMENRGKINTAHCLATGQCARQLWLCLTHGRKWEKQHRGGNRTASAQCPVLFEQDQSALVFSLLSHKYVKNTHKHTHNIKDEECQCACMRSSSCLHECCWSRAY